MSPLRLSVIVPFHDNAGQLQLCLAALKASSEPHELILVDDASTDRRAIDLAGTAGGFYVKLERNSGPAVARNAGAKIARGDVLVFIDSDVVVERETLAKLRATLETERTAAAVFGSYDDTPATPGVVTEYRNLVHHHYHQIGPREATTFWAGCGAMRKSVFERLGGFDESYRRPSIEDIELGMRLKSAGERVLLVPSIQCKHLKRWRFFDMIAVDVTRRAIPWAKLLIDRPGTGGDLNLQANQKLCVVLVFLAAIALPLAIWIPSWRAAYAWGWAPLALLAPLVAINRRLYGLFLRRKGVVFAVQGFLLHVLYYVYGGLAYAWVRLTHRRRPDAQRGA